MITKRHLGYAFIAVGLLVIVGVLAANFIGARDAGFGPLQLIGLAAGAGAIAIAIPLIKLGNRPA